MIGARENKESRFKGTYDLKALEELIASLLQASQDGAAVIVEGRRERKRWGNDPPAIPCGSGMDKKIWQPSKTTQLLDLWFHRRNVFLSFQ